MISAKELRLDGLVPNTPRVGSANKQNSSSRRSNLATPAMSRVKAEPTSSPPEFKTPHRPDDKLNGAVYVSKLPTSLS
jgi:DNA polymerase alpha subunit B